MQLTGRWMREIFVELLIERARRDKRICYVEADLMLASGMRAFQQEFPERTINVGVAEANMIGVAAGISSLGMVPFTHTFAPFATRRCCDQVTLSVSYSKNNVKMVGSDPGVTAMLNGGTHMSFEDVAIMRNIPGMCVVEPVDGFALHGLFEQIVEYPGAVYLRLLRREAKSVYNEKDTFVLGKPNVLRDGDDVTIIASGIMVYEAMLAVEKLSEAGISAGLIDVHTIKPLNEDIILDVVGKSSAVVTCENHSVINGLGSAIAELLSEKCPMPLKRIGIKDHFGEVGMQDFLSSKYGLTSEKIFEACNEVLTMKRRK